jgi:hypothetical protein
MGCRRERAVDRGGKGCCRPFSQKRTQAKARKKQRKPQNVEAVAEAAADEEEKKWKKEDAARKEAEAASQVRQGRGLSQEKDGLQEAGVAAASMGVDARSWPTAAAFTTILGPASSPKKNPAPAASLSRAATPPARAVACFTYQCLSIAKRVWAKLGPAPLAAPEEAPAF